MTIGEAYGPAMEITDQAEADSYFEMLVHAALKQGATDRATAESNIRVNLGYYAGYCNNKTRARVEKLFHCAHPVFGAIAEKGSPTPEQAVAAGVAMAKATPHA